MFFLTVPHCLLLFDGQVGATVSSPILYQHILNYTEKKKAEKGESGYIRIQRADHTGFNFAN